MIPNQHYGQEYRGFMSNLTKTVGSRCYLEVGVSSGDLMASVATGHAVGVDPQYNITRNVTASKGRVELFQMTSDDFFRKHETYIGGLGPDIAFLDGFHVFDYLLRDFMNTERACNRDALIFLHDCLPLTAEMAHPDIHEAIRLGQSGAFPNYWTGDVWKVVAILKEYRPDLVITAIDCAPTGLISVGNLDPESTILSSAYNEIVARFSALPNDIAGIEAFYKSIQIHSASSVAHHEFAALKKKTNRGRPSP